jgi:hypothetical protein
MRTRIGALSLVSPCGSAAPRSDSEKLQAMTDEQLVDFGGRLGRIPRGASVAFRTRSTIGRVVGGVAQARSSN